MSHSASAVRCAICAEAAAPQLLQDCFNCGRTFHLNPYNNQPGKDCGDALIGASLGVHYLCDICLAEIDAEANAPAPFEAAPPPHAPPPAGPPPLPPRQAPRRRYRRQDPP